MKRKIFFKTLLICILCFLLVGCGTKDNTDISAGEETEKETLELAEKEEVENQVPEPEKKEIVDLDLLLLDENEVDITILETIYTIQDEKHKTLYPDLLQVIMQNNTEKDIKDAVVAFAAWDVNNLPVKLKGSIDFSDGSYIKEVSYEDINLIGGATYGKDSGFEIDENIDVSKFEAIVVSYEDFDGDHGSILITMILKRNMREKNTLNKRDLS